MSDISKENNMGTAQNDNAQASAPPVDHIVTTEHSAVIRGQALDYTATTGTMVVETAGKKCEIFFTAYTMDEDESTAGRASSARRSGAANRSGAAPLRRSEPLRRIGPPPDICFQRRAGIQFGVDAHGIFRAAPHRVR